MGVRSDPGTSKKSPPDTEQRPPGRFFAVRAFQGAAISTAVVFGTAILLAMLWYGMTVLLLVFAGILLATFLRGLADWLSARTGLSIRLSMAAVTLGLLVLMGAGFYFLVPQVASQIDQISSEFPTMMDRLKERLSQSSLGQRALDIYDRAGRFGLDQGEWVGRLAGIFATLTGAVGSALVVGFVGLYLAFGKDDYYRGLILLVPPPFRRRTGEVLTAVGVTLRHWIIAIAIEMVILAAVVSGGLLIIGVPFALTLGILAGLLHFIPYLGAILSFLPAALMALLTGHSTLVYVVGFFIAVHVFEGYVLSPLIQGRAVHIPSAVIITAQAFMGVLMGILGILLATPLAACAMVLVKMFYLEDVLEERVEVPAVHGRGKG